MKTKVEGLNVGYWDKGKGRVLLLLHGWSRGISRERYKELVDELAKYCRVVVPDFPGFGESDAQKDAWGVVDYTFWLERFLDKLKVKPEIVAGHSFGGRVAIKLAVRRKINFDKLILIDSAGVERKSLKIKVLRKISGLTPRLVKERLRNMFGSKDYLEAKGAMRESVAKIVNENQEEEMKDIQRETVLIWGEEDRTTPLWQAKIIGKNIKNSKLVIVKGGNHGLPYRKTEEVARIIRKFIQ